MSEIAPPGHLISIGDSKFHYTYNDNGNNAPTVVLEAGWGADHLIWSLVRPQIETFASVFSYDRAGMGWSDFIPTPRNSENIAQELHALLEKAEIPTPYILVGHSRGGLFVRHFAHCYPDKVAGMILVDSVHEQGYTHYPQELQDFVRQSLESLLTTCKTRMTLTHEEIIEQINAEQTIYSGENNPFPSHIQKLQQDRQRPHSYEARVYELEWRLQQPATEISTQTPPNLGDIPLIVLYVDSPKIPDLSTEVNDAFAKITLSYQQEFAGLSTNGRLQHVPNSRHNIQLDQPQTVIDAVQEIVNLTKGA